MSPPVQHQTQVVVEPATGTVLGEIETANAGDVANCIERARQGQQQWRKLASEVRADLLRRWRGLIVQQSDTLATLLSRENGKPVHEALLHEIVALTDALDFHAETAPVLLREHTTSPRWYKHRTHVTTRRPRGVVAIVTPFNFPLLIAGSDAAAALVMGCAAILKPSPSCPLIVQRLVELAHQAGIPDSILQVIHGGADVGQQLIRGGVDAVVFTGGVDNGRAVARLCGEQLMACTLELGGNCPLVVLDDADLDRTARAIAVGTFTNSGQSCLAVGRVLAPRSRVGSLVERLEPIIRGLRQGNPTSQDVNLGALTTRAQVLRCHQHVNQSIAHGARAIVGRQAEGAVGNFYPPTMLVGCSPESDVFRHETFGPVLPVVAYDDLDNAVAQLNQDRFGLAAYVFGNNLERARQIAQVLEFGQVVIDQVLLTYVCPEVPLSALRDSGLGVVHGAEGLLAHTTPTVIGTPKLRLPTALELGWSDPKHARKLAQGYLATNQAWTKLMTWTTK